MLQIMRRCFEGHGLSTEVVNIMLGSWRDSTFKQYQSSIIKWENYVKKRGCSFLRPSVVDVLEFFNTVRKDVNSYSAVNTARSALSAFVELGDGTSVGTNM